MKIFMLCEMMDMSFLQIWYCTNKSTGIELIETLEKFMKTEPEIRKMMDDLEDKMQEVNSKLENVLLKSEYLELNSIRNKLKIQYNILLEVLK